MPRSGEPIDHPFRVARPFPWFRLSVVYKCPSCQAGLSTPLARAGTSDKCPECGAEFSAPGQEARDSVYRRRGRHAGAQRSRVEVDHPVVFTPKVRAPRPAESDADKLNRHLLSIAIWLALGGATLLGALIVSIRNGGPIEDGSLGWYIRASGLGLAAAAIFASITSVLVRVLLSERVLSAIGLVVGIALSMLGLIAFALGLILEPGTEGRMNIYSTWTKGMLINNGLLAFCAGLLLIAAVGVQYRIGSVRKELLALRESKAAGANFGARAEAPAPR